MRGSQDTNNRQYYDDFSDWYERERGGGYHALIDQLEVDVIRPLATGKRVLEAGCGTGLILSRLAPLAQRAYGFDISPGMVEQARNRGLDVTLGSVTQVPFADASFDLVCSFKVLAHVPDIRAAVAELVRVTAPGGYLALEFYNPLSLRYLAKRVAGPQPISDGRNEADVFTRWDTPRQVKALFPANVDIEDFRGVRVVTPAAFVHRLPVVRKMFAAAERHTVESPLRYFGGFLLAIARKRA